MSLPWSIYFAGLALLLVGVWMIPFCMLWRHGSFAKLFAKLKVFDWRDGLLVIGAALVFRGVYMLLPALAYIVLGCALVWFALFIDRRRK